MNRRGGRTMVFRVSTGVVFLLSSLLLTNPAALAGPKEDVAAATMKWGETLGQHDPDRIVLLYATDGVLWGTLSPTVRSDRAALRDYFVGAFKVLPALKVTFADQLRLLPVTGRNIVTIVSLAAGPVLVRPQKAPYPAARRLWPPRCRSDESPMRFARSTTRESTRRESAAYA